MTREQIGDTIKVIREAFGWSQTELAKKAGVKQPAISSVEKGEDKYGEKTIRKICTALGISVALTISPDEENDIDSI